MSTLSTNNLIGFLAKRSLFKNELHQKDKNNKKTNDFYQMFSTSITPKKKNDTKSQVSELNVFNDRQEKQWSQKGISEVDYSSVKAAHSIPIKPQQKTRFSIKNQQTEPLTNIKKNPKRVLNPQIKTISQQQPAKQNIFMNFQTQPTQLSQKQKVKTFESLQSESQNCLRRLSTRLQKEMHNINQMIEQYNCKIFKLLNSQLSNIRDKISSMVEEAFKECEKNIQLYLKQSQRLILNEVSQVKQKLQIQSEKIEQMKQAIKTIEWRKAAAELIACDLEHKVEEILDQACKIRLPSPKIDKKLQKQKLSNLNNSLKSLFNLQNWNNSIKL